MAFLPTSLVENTSHLGVTIEKDGVFLVSLKRQNKIDNAVTHLSPEPIIVGNKINDALLVSALQDSLVKLGRSKNRQAAIIIPESLVYTRSHTLPNLTNHEIDEALLWQVGDIFPFNQNEIEFDWKLVSKTSDQAKIQVVAIQKDLINLIVDSFEKVGLKVGSIEPMGSLFGRSFKAKSQFGVIYISAKEATISLVENGLSKVTSTISLTKANQTLTTLIESHLSKEFKIDESNPIPIYLTGPKSADFNIQDLESKLIKFEAWPNKDVKPEYQTSYAAAIESVFPPESVASINLLPLTVKTKYQQTIKETQEHQLLIYGISLSVIGLIAAIGLFLFSNIKHSIISKSLSSSTSASALDSTANRIVAKIQRINRLKPTKSYPKDLIQAILTIQTPVKINRYSIDIAKKEVLFSVSGKSRSDFLAFKSSLEATNLFKLVKLPLSAITSEGEIDVLVTATIK